MQTEVDRSSASQLPRLAGAALCAALGLPAQAQAPEFHESSCDANWSAEFGRLSSTDASVYGLAAFDDGNGPALYAAGSFTSIGGLAANRIARWDGRSWTTLGSGIGGGTVSALLVFDDGSGTALIAGGNFSSAGPIAASGIARWNGASWSALGGGVSGGQVSALCNFDDGNGRQLYASGTFTGAGGLPVEHIARWDGSSWSALAGGWSSGSPLAIQSLAVFDDGGGDALYAGGMLQLPGGPPTSFVARWSGSAWTLLTSPTDSGETVLTLAAGDLGSGPRLFAGGNFLTIGGVPANDVAQWDGNGWSALGSGMDYFFEPPVRSLSILYDSLGPALYAGGRFSTAGGSAASNIARWDGAQWSPLHAGVDGAVCALGDFKHGTAGGLVAGGAFLHAGGHPSAGLAEWSSPPGCGEAIAFVCEPGSAGTSPCPCSNPPAGAGRGCDNSAATGGAQLAQSGAASLGNDTLRFTATGAPPDALSMLLQGTQFAQGGLVFGQGVRCTSGTLTRLYSGNAASGTISLPGPGDPSVSARSAQLGDPITQGAHRYYGIYYRDPHVLGGCPATSTLNISQQLDLLWHL